MNRRVMAIGAHPDDIEFGCSGTLLQHRKDGDDVVMVIMTNTQSISGVTGETLRSAEELKHESICSAEILDCNVEFLSFTDLHVPFNFDSISQLEKLMVEYNDDISLKEADKIIADNKETNQLSVDTNED